MTIECSNSAYEKLQVLGIQQRTKLVKEELTQIFLYRTIWAGEANKILEATKRAKQSGAVLNEEKKDILSLEAELEADSFILRIDPFVIKHPFLVAKIVLGKDLGKFSQYSFSSKKNLASAINAYCIGERKAINDDKESYVWRQRENKNNICLVDHGDLSVSQIDVSKKEESGVLIDPPSSGFGLQQDWSPFLISVLKYAQSIGKRDIPEIKDWQELVRTLRTSNPWGNDYSKDFTKTELHLAAQFNDDLSGAGNNNLVLWINDRVLPHFNDGALDILRLDEKGDLEISLYKRPAKCQRIAHYIPEDIPHLLKANYQLYARSVNDMAKIMHQFNIK